MFASFRIPFLSPYYYLGSSDLLQKIIKEKGDPETKTFRTTLPDRNVLFVSDKNMLKEMMVTKSNNFEKPKLSYELLNIFGESILTCLNNETWKKHFKVCSPGFSPVNLQFMCKVAVKSCDLLFEKWEQELKRQQGATQKMIMLQVEHYSDATLDILGKAVLNGRDPTFDDFEKLEYVNMVIMESLRYHPPVTTVVKHVAKKSTTLGKFKVPKGTQIHAFIFG
ncbi:hypothetical protein FDP41_008515 [Naegleria fowleri]|uniref:Cytochrome P450 n=1 Tax=Naegleria fowleri TaxID=5763 RepID=A0A6A5BGZ9_NAEFO|nr:uncharacterized protein FDP41_008515 [Naegleria fowleri]KAF0973308.1 hypothetical protein FDP41_008515 [Naegleria fowleri]